MPSRRRRASQRRRRFSARVAAAASLAVATLLALLPVPLPAAETVTVTVLATTDTHGHLLPWDYYAGEPAPRGLAAAATLVARVRRETRNVLLVDCGDTIQGSPLEGVHQAAVRAGETSAPDPMMLAMSRMRYDAMAVGNHEFNFGLYNLARAREAARFPWLSANTLSGDALPAFAPFVVKSVGGVKVAVVGITTPAVPEWEKPENIPGFSWLDPVEAVRRALAALRPEAPDAVVVAIHGGLDRDPRTRERRKGAVPGENAAWQVAEAHPSLAAVVFGHTHRREEGLRVGDVLLVQPRPWAMEVARVDLTFEREEGGAFRLVGRESRLVPVRPETVPDPEILALAEPYHAAAERYLARPVATSAVDLDGSRGRFEDSALVDAIHEVQLHYTGADVSLASLFRTETRVPRGDVSVRELAALYVYDNELYAVEGSGLVLREALENAARYFLTCPDPACGTGPLVDRSVPGFNYDTAQGVFYEIDLRRPAGDRVRNLRFRGAPLADGQPLRIAVNSYRAAGSAGYGMLRDAPVVWRSGREVRELMIEYFSERGRLPSSPDGNWRLVPPAAVDTLASEGAAPRSPGSGVR